jgi:carbonic anhydrase
MKLVKRNLVNLRKFLICSILFICVNTLTTTTKSGSKKLFATTETEKTVFEFLKNLHRNDPANTTLNAPEAAAAGNVTALLNNLNPGSINNTSPFIVDLNDPNVNIADWMSISSEAFNNPNKYPTIKDINGRDMNIKFGTESQRYNEQFQIANAQGSGSAYNFWFKLHGGYIYYFATKEDINILGSVLIKSIENSFHKNRVTNGTDSCFNVWDYSQDRYRICALTKDIKLKWMCSLQQFLHEDIDDQCTPHNKMGNFGLDSNTLVEIKKVTQPVIIIPIASRNCNEKFDYIAKGKNWECTCAEGREQSPIDLPSKEKALLSELKPLFQYDKISAVATESTVDGSLVAGENIKIRFDRGALRIQHPNMGKIVALDGGVYVAEEIVFHTPSEHTINGVHYDMEMQIIHYGKSVGDIAKQMILSFLFKAKPGVYNKFLDKLDFFNLPNSVDTFRDINQDLFIPSIFYTTEDDDVPSMKPFSFYTYEGSLTAPPCTERTTHFVAADPIELSSTVISLFKEALRSPDIVNNKGEIVLTDAEGDVTNNRYVQPLNGRTVFVYDHNHFNCPEFKKKKRSILHQGHYEKRDVKNTQYIFVNGDSPSNIPNSFVVSEAEAKGVEGAIPGDEDRNESKLESQP